MFNKLLCRLALYVLVAGSMVSGIYAQDESLLEDDLLAADTVTFDLPEEQETATWRKDIRITLQQTFSQGDMLEVSRSEARLEYESAPWEGAYVRLDHKYRYFSPKDQQARVQGESFGHNKLQEAWLQVSESDCVAKAGRQGLYWGGVEGTFAVDVITPFDFSEPLLTDYSNVRLTQDMLRADCYFSNTRIQVFYVPEARISSIHPRQNASLDKLENSLEDEMGARITQSWEGLDLSLMYAHLYGNTPVTLLDFSLPDGIRLGVSRYDFFAFSSAWAIGRLLIELDIAYKKDQLLAFSGVMENQIETAFGFEYTTFNNHQLNAGVWLFDEVAQIPGAERSTVQSWTFGWSKTYLNDDLTMSILGLWASEPDQLTTTILGQYQWNDYWHFSSALTYTDADASAQSILVSDSELTLLIKAKFQF